MREMFPKVFFIVLYGYRPDPALAHYRRPLRKAGVALSMGRPFLVTGILLKKVVEFGQTEAKVATRRAPGSDFLFLDPAPHRDGRYADMFASSGEVDPRFGLGPRMFFLIIVHY